MVRGKKGLSESGLAEYVLSILFFVVILMTLRLLVGNFVDDSTDTVEIQAEVFFNKMMYDSGLFWNEDSFGNTIPGEIIFDRLSDETLNGWTDYIDDRHIAAKVTLRGGSGEQIKEAFYQRQWYSRWEPLAKSGITGLGSARMFEKWVPVTYLQDGERKRGFLEVGIVVPNS